MKTYTMFNVTTWKWETLPVGPREMKALIHAKMELIITQAAWRRVRERLDYANGG